MPTNVIDAKGADKKDAQDKQGVEKTIYIGVFFDGTKNNKFQVTLGKYFHLKEDYEAARNGTSKTAKDKLMFGRDANSKDNWFIEESIHTADIYDLPLSQTMDNEKGLVGQGSFAEMPNDSLYNMPNDSLYNNSIDTNTVDITSPEDFKSDLERGRERYKEILEDYKKAYANNGKSDSIEKFASSKGADGQDVHTYTNVAVLEALYESKSEDYFPLYIEGPGTDLNLAGSSNILTAMSNKGSKLKGQVAGTGDNGVEAKVKKAITAVRNICYRFTSQTDIEKLNVHLSTYGFSRGATGARVFSSHSNDKDRSKDDAKKDLLGESIAKKVNELVLDFVGLFDSVSSEGLVYKNDVDDLKLWAINHAEAVLHLCAMDEFRDHFALTDIRSTDKKGLEIFMPGCHTDVGGATQIGLDDWKVIKTTPKNKLEKSQKEHFVINAWGRKGESEYYLINLATLKNMGWIPSEVFEAKKEGKTIDDGATYELYDPNNLVVGFIQGSNIRFKKYSTPGYSNIPLHLMHKKALEKSIPFSSIPSSYQVSDPLLSRLLGEWKKDLSGVGQKFVSVSNQDYRSLRSKFLHYSANDSPYVSTDVIERAIDGATYIKLDGDSYRSLITRKIYEGIQNSRKTYYLHEISSNPAPPDKKEFYLTAPPEPEKKKQYWTAPKSVNDDLYWITPKK